jgi:MFS family permease
MALNSRLGALQEPQFRLFWLGRTTSAIGDGLIGVALAFAVIHETGSAADLGLVMACFTFGRAGLVVVAGVWADRLPRRLVMITADVVRAVGQGVVAFLLISGTAEIWHLAVAAFVSGAANAFFGPSSTAFVPDAVSPGRLQQANALISTSGSAAELLGPAVSGLLVWSVGAGWVFAIDAASYAFSAAFLLAMRVRETPREERRPFLREVVGGLRMVVERRWLWVSLASFALGNVALASYFVIAPVVAERELDGARDWGLILSGGSVGALAGSLLALRWRPTRPLLVGNLVMLLEPAMFLALIPPLPLVGLAICTAMTFLGIALFNALWETVLQERVPRRALSRVTSLDWLVSFVFMPIGYTIAGPLSENVGIKTTLGFGAALAAAAVALPLCFAGVRDLRRSSNAGRAGEAGTSLTSGAR